MSLHKICLYLLMAGAAAAQTADLAGDYSGALGPLHLKLHLKNGANGVLEGTMDSPDQGASGLPCTNFKREGQNLSFDVPSVHGNWRGKISDDAKALTGTWSQGADIPLAFQRDEPAGKPSRVDGIWLGTLETGGPKLRVQVTVKSDASGKEHCALDSLDQGATGLPCDNVQFDGKKFSFDVPVVQGHYAGMLSDDGNQLTGTWRQLKELPLTMTRQKAAIAATQPEPPKFEPAMKAVAAADLKPVLDNDLSEALKKGALAPATRGGIAIGILQHGARHVFAYGPVQENSIFEIGSITKTFTGLILAQMVEKKKVKFDEPVRELLPAGTVAKPAGPEITLLDLATQNSGLPRMPDNFHPADMDNPYADYRAANLYEYIGKHGVTKPANVGFAYSNLGLGLLGQALANCAGTSYPELLQREITGPLELHDTVVKLSPEQQKRFAQGYNAQHQAAHAWDLDALAGAGAIRSTAADMLTYLAAQLHPEKTPDSLPQAIPLSHELRADVAPGMKIALAWLYDEKTGNYWHNGATGGYSSYAYFNPKEDTAVVVLFNTTIGPAGSFSDRVGKHIGERLTGKAAISLAE